MPLLMFASLAETLNSFRFISEVLIAKRERGGKRLMGSEQHSESFASGNLQSIDEVAFPLTSGICRMY